MNPLQITATKLAIVSVIVSILVLVSMASVSSADSDKKSVKIEAYPSHELKIHPSVDIKNPMTSFHSVYDAIDRYLPDGVKEQVKRVLYGKPAEDRTSELPDNFRNHPDFEVQYFSLAKHAAEEQRRAPRLVKVGAIQHGIVEPTSAPVNEQYEAIKNKVEKMIDAAGQIGVNVLSLQVYVSFTSPHEQPLFTATFLVTNHIHLF